MCVRSTIIPTRMHLIRIVTVGDAGVGKSALLHRYRTNSFSADGVVAGSTCEYKATSVVIDDQKLKLQIWDFSGQAKYQSMNKVMYQRTHGVAVIFDVTKKETFLSLPKWLKEIETETSSDCKVLLCANKTDLPKKEWQVTRSEFSKFAVEV